MWHPLEALAAAARELCAEKRIQQLTIRVPPSLVRAINDDAARQDRSPTDIIVRILLAHYFGNVRSSMFTDSTLEGQSFRDSQRSALEDR